MDADTATSHAPRGRGRSPVSRLTDAVTDALGHEVAFPLAVAIAVAWLVAGTSVGLHETLVGTVTTVATLIMVFAVQHTSSREARALNLKLDELIRVSDARNELIGAEDEPHRSLDRRRAELRGATRPRSDSG